MGPEIIAGISAANMIKKGTGFNSKNLSPLMALGAAVAVGTGTASVFKKGHRPIFLETGYVGVRTRRGQPIVHRRGEQAGQAKVVGPGFRFAFPLVNSLRIVSVQDRAIRLEEKDIDRPEGQYKVDSSVIWGINSELADRSIFKTDALITSVGDICQSAFRVAAFAVSAADIKSPDLESTLFEIMKDRSHESLERYGAELRALNLGVFARTAAQMQKESFQLLAGGSALGHLSTAALVAQPQQNGISFVENPGYVTD